MMLLVFTRHGLQHEELFLGRVLSFAGGGSQKSLNAKLRSLSQLEQSGAWRGDGEPDRHSPSESSRALG